jgi:hypothetical protein
LGRVSGITDEELANLSRYRESGVFGPAEVLVLDIAMGNLRSRFNRVFQCRPAGLSEGAYCPLPEK